MQPINRYNEKFTEGKSVMLWRPGDFVQIFVIDEIPATIADDKLDWENFKLIDSIETFYNVMAQTEHIETLQHNIERLKKMIDEKEKDIQNIRVRLRDVWIGLPSEPSAKSAYLPKSGVGLEREEMNNET